MAIAGGFRRYLAGRYMRFGIFCVTLYIPVNFKMMKRIVVLYVILALAVSCGGRGTAKRAAAAPAAPQAPVSFREPAEYTYRVKAVYPHDTGAYTQGLFWLDGYLYEGTGQNGRSELRRVEPATGRVLQRVGLERKYFGEGIAYLGGKIYQLTWVAGRAFVYDAEDFRPLRSFVYDGEGWGLTTDGEYLYMSDGSDKIYVRDAENFGVVRTLQVTAKGRPVDMLNELEWIEGRIWANLYLYAQVVVIDPQTGEVTGVVDFEGLQEPSDRTPETDVFNGIAYDAASGDIYVTGKNWNKLYKVEIFEKEKGEE